MNYIHLKHLRYVFAHFMQKIFKIYKNSHPEWKKIGMEDFRKHIETLPNNTSKVNLVFRKNSVNLIKN